MRVLVVFGSKMGGTEGIAHDIGAALTEAGHAVDVRNARGVEGVSQFDAVVVGGGLYAGRWQKDARRFVHQNVDELRAMPVFFFSSGPLDDSATTRDIPPTPQVKRLMQMANANEHMTFGGRLDAAHAHGFIARAMVKNGKGGDFRDLNAIRRWSAHIAASLAQLPAKHVDARPRHARATRTSRRLLTALCTFTAVTAIGGGLALVVFPLGGGNLLPVEMLQGTPFSTFLVPGLLLAGVVGLLNALAALAVWRRRDGADGVAFVAGGALGVWIVVEVSMIHSVHWLHVLYLAIGLVTCALAFVSRAPLVHTALSIVRSHTAPSRKTSS